MKMQPTKLIISVVLIILAISIFLTSCSQPLISSVENEISFDMYSQKYSKDIISLIENKTQEDGILGYSNMYTDMYTTFYALSIFELFKSDGISINPNVLNEKIISAIIECEQKQDFFELDSLYCLLNILDISNNTALLSPEMVDRIEAVIKKYADIKENYNDSVLLYRIVKIEKLLNLSVLDIKSLEILCQKEIAEVDEESIFDIYTTIYIANTKGIEIDSAKINKCLQIADKKINEIYLLKIPSFPDLYQLFELISYISPGYNFDTQKLMNQVSSFKVDNVFFSIATTESINLLPTYWALEIQEKIGVAIEKSEQITIEIKKAQNLDGFCRFASENKVIPSESNAANVINTILGGENTLPIKHIGKISENYAREVYCYSLALIEAGDIKKINSFSNSLETSLNSISDKSGAQYLYPAYFQTLSLKLLKNELKQKIKLPQFNLISNYESGTLNNSEIEFLILLLDNLIEKESKDGYSISNSVKKVIQEFISSGCYKEIEMSNDTLALLYLSIQLIEDDVKSSKEICASAAIMLKGFLLDDGLFCFGILDREATYDSTLMGLEILKMIS